MPKIRNYKIVNAFSKSMGSAGAQILLGRVDKIDAQSSSNGWLEGVKLSWLMSDVTGTGGGSLNFGGIFYLTTDDTWSDDYIIAVGAAGNMSGSVYLRARRSIRTKANPDSYNDIAAGTGGPIYIWGEVSDSTLTANVTCRIVTETWGRNIIYTEV